MPRIAKELSATEVRRLTFPGLYAVGGVPGLLLQVGSGQSRSWILRTMVGSRRRDIGLGGYPAVTLAGARLTAREMRESIRSGIDPIEARKEAKAALVASQAQRRTFVELAREVYAVKKLEFKNAKHSAQWINTLETYAFPHFGDRAIAEITADDVLGALRDLWLTKNETATRVRQRMDNVFTYAIQNRYCSGPSPASWPESLKGRLPDPSKLARKAGGKKHHPRVSIEAVPGFLDDLLNRESVSARALAFAVLTAARSGEIRGATWDEIDFKSRVWTVPAERMKSGRLHRVPLSSDAVNVLECCSRASRSKLIFPGKNGMALSDNTLSKLIKDMHQQSINKGGKGYLDREQQRIATPHGTARSTFKDWSRRNTSYRMSSGDLTSFPDEWAELALAHVNDDATRAAYARDELLDERRVLMQAWADYLTSGGGTWC
ncbi:integrase arm-type DNA-binding domain-containing protein [Pseudomonas sp. gcc21]|uniref:tyrosine-type recombinase/integrase n=1 Tax=Pseudomonas sp. gcc21 TaxID=2726989 RepID=UPI001451FE8E|nr:site-specific integrase [Pseudomonas sp. gcc21]QJD57599.1 integrase arm-type DNA-binding domain-containing protein [Pseudomonas sp. gcc21]